eukprot:scaffold62927_cov32-Tisochrysis_lutea.AAC.4
MSTTCIRKAELLDPAFLLNTVKLLAHAPFFGRLAGCQGAASPHWLTTLAVPRGTLARIASCHVIGIHGLLAAV